MRTVDQLQQAGRRAGRHDRLTATPAAAAVGNTAASVRPGSAAGRRPTVISVIMPSVPSEPMNSGPGRSRPRPWPSAGRVAAPRRRPAPPPGPDVRARHAVLHAAHAAGVGRDVATDRGRLPGSRVGWVEQTGSATARASAAFTTPGCTTAVRLTGSISTMRFIAVSDTMTAPSKRWPRRPARSAPPEARSGCVVPRRS